MSGRVTGYAEMAELEAARAGDRRRIEAEAAENTELVWHTTLTPAARQRLTVTLAKELGELAAYAVEQRVKEIICERDGHDIPDPNLTEVLGRPICPRCQLAI